MTHRVSYVLKPRRDQVTNKIKKLATNDANKQTSNIHIFQTTRKAFFIKEKIDLYCTKWQNTSTKDKHYLRKKKEKKKAKVSN